MAVFMAGVGTAELFKVTDGVEHLFSTAKTLTESGITIGVSEEDIRAGEGAKLYGKYFHTSTFDLKMTDAMFKLEYIAANVGSEIEVGGDAFKNISVTSSGTKEFTFTGTDAIPLPVSMLGTEDIYVYAKQPSEDVYQTYKVTSNKITLPIANKEYCIKYLYTNENARTLNVRANFIPDTLRVYLTTNLYSGDDKNPSTGTKIGTVTVMIPRFLLKGNQDLSMSMTGASTTSFEGSALASEANGCEDDGIYAKIIEVIGSYQWRHNVRDLILEDAGDKNASGEYSKAVTSGSAFTDTIIVWATFDNMAPKKLVGGASGADYTITGTTGITPTYANGNGSIAGTISAAGEVTIALNSDIFGDKSVITLVKNYTV